MQTPRPVVTVAQPAGIDGFAAEALQQALHRARAGVISFATGATFTAFFGLAVPAVAARLRDGELPALTHLDEFLGFGHAERGGMLCELLVACPPLGDALVADRFWPVPSDGARESLQRHEARIRDAGGIALQFLGLGRNGHLAFNEPGTPFDSGFHVAELAPSTRADARPRFAPAEPPQWAVTAGLATIFAARRIVLVATGHAKAPAVRAMLEGPVTPECPASILQQHPDTLVLLDPAAASELRQRPEAGVAP